MGKIEWLIPDFEERYFGYRPFENEQCRECKYLPLCWGECPRSFEVANLRASKFKCVKSRQNDMSFEESILNIVCLIVKLNYYESTDCPL